MQPSKARATKVWSFVPYLLCVVDGGGNPLCAFHLKLSNEINPMLSVQSSPKKHFHSRRTQITSYHPPSCPHSEGRFAIVTNVGHGMRWTRRHQARESVLDE
jgi:hypothetical protein